MAAKITGCFGWCFWKITATIMSWSHIFWFFLVWWRVDRATYIQPIVSPWNFYLLRTFPSRRMSIMSSMDVDRQWSITFGYMRTWNHVTMATSSLTAKALDMIFGCQPQKRLQALPSFNTSLFLYKYTVSNNQWVSYTYNYSKAML